jgi:type I restriction enzyme M protein
MKTPKRCRDAIFVSATRGLFEYRADDAFLEVSPDDPRLGGTVAQRNKRLFQLMDGVARLDLGDTEERRIDIFGDAYEYLMRMYASSAGKSGGEYFTPPEVSRLLMTIALDGRDHVNKVYEIPLPKLIQNQAA